MIREAKQQEIPTCGAHFSSLFSATEESQSTFKQGLTGFPRANVYDLQLQRPFRLHKSQGTSYPAQKKVGMPPQALSGHQLAQVSRCASDIGSLGVNTTIRWQPGEAVPPSQQPLLQPPILGQACQTATAAREARSLRSQAPGPRTPVPLSSEATATKLRFGHYRSSQGGTPREWRKQPARAPWRPTGS